MKRFYNSESRNRAAYILASMSPDMISAIVALVGERGSSLVAELMDGDGPPRALAFGSKDFISDEDFPEVWTGLMTTYMAAYRQPADGDFYEKILMDGAAAPKPLAQEMAKQIETWDPIVSYQIDSQGKKTKVSAVKKMYLQAAEGVRKAVNYLPSLLGLNWENDQSQQMDFDRLYEMKLLGRAIGELASRSRLMSGQEKIMSSMTVLGQTGDVAYDPVDQAEIELISAAQPLVGAPVPLSLFGLLANFVKKATKTNAANLESELKQAGVHPESTPSTTDPAKQAAYRRLVNSDSDSLEPIVQKCRTTEQMGDVLQATRTRTAKGLSDSALNLIEAQHGADVADAIAQGDVATGLATIMSDAGDNLLTTGDPGLDEDIITSTLNEINGAYDDFGPEIGGLFTRARINKNMKRAARFARKNKRKQAKIQRRNVKQSGLLASRDAVNRNRYAFEEAPEYDDQRQEMYAEDDYGYQDYGEDSPSDYDSSVDYSNVDISAGLEPV